MKRGKMLFIGLIVLSLLIVSAIGVSAGWWNSFTGNAAKSATAKVDVTGIASPPRIWFVSSPNSTSLLNANNNQGVSYHSFNFLACSIGGAVVLPDNSEIATDITPFTGFNGSYGSPIQNFAPAISCNVIGDVSLLPPGGVCNGQSRNYTCTVRMRYYYDPITWNINVTLKDNSNNFATNSTRTFNLNPNTGWDNVPAEPIYVNWTGVTIGGSNKASDNNITMIPIGNIDVGTGGLAPSANPLEINATPLNGTTPGLTYQQILGNNFKSGGENACISGAALSNNQYVTITGFFADHRLSTPVDTGGNPVRTNLTFCLTTLSGIDAQSYETNPSAKWTLNTVNY